MLTHLQLRAPSWQGCVYMFVLSHCLNILKRAHCRPIYNKLTYANTHFHSIQCVPLLCAWLHAVGLAAGSEHVWHPGPDGEIQDCLRPDLCGGNGAAAGKTLLICCTYVGCFFRLAYSNRMNSTDFGMARTFNWQFELVLEA